MRKISLLSKVKKIIIDITCKSVHSKINKKMMDLLNQTFCSCVYGVKAKKRYILCFAKNTAYGLDGSATVYAYTSDAYLYALPDALLSWIKPLRNVDGWSNKLEYNCLFTKEGEQGWIGPKAE